MGAAHSNTQEKEKESIDSLLGYREDTEGEEGRSGTKETEDVTWGPRDSQVLPKYEEIKGPPLRGWRRDGINKRYKRGKHRSKMYTITNVRPRHTADPTIRDLSYRPGNPYGA